MWRRTGQSLSISAHLFYQSLSETNNGHVSAANRQRSKHIFMLCDSKWQFPSFRCTARIWGDKSLRDKSRHAAITIFQKVTKSEYECSPDISNHESWATCKNDLMKALFLEGFFWGSFSFYCTVGHSGVHEHVHIFGQMWAQRKVCN